MFPIDYSKVEIVANKISDLVKLSDGTWERKWSIKIKENISTNLDLEEILHKLSYESFQVLLESASHGRLNIVVKTNFSNTDYLFFNTCNLFAEIDHLLGEIEIIQESIRDSWYPWLARKNGQVFKVSRWIKKEIEVGVRNLSQEKLCFFGIEEVNRWLEDGAKITLIEPGEAIARTNDGDNGSEVSFFLRIFLDKHSPSLATDLSGAEK